MVSRATIKALVDRTESKYRKCWETLSRLKKPQGTEGADLFEDMLEFQPTLARVLYDLSEMHRTLRQEKQSTVAKKGRVSPEWFRRRMRQLDDYQKVLKATISIGKHLGDAFAWLFYGDETEHLREHYRQQRQLYAPPGIGGLGELKFIEKARLVKGHLVLYHNTTTFLTLGDFSLINMEDLSLSAVGELKTTQIAEDQLSINVTTVGWPKEPIIVGVNEDKGNADDESVPSPLPQNMRARLDRQIASIVKSFDTSEPKRRMDLETNQHKHQLEALVSDLKVSSFTYKKIGDGLLMTGLRTRKRTLSNKLMARGTFAWNGKKCGLKEAIQDIVDQESTENEFWHGLYNNPTSEYRLGPGMVPMFWWPIDLRAVRDIVFYDVALFSIYNPIHLMHKLRRAGFDVESLRGQRGLRVKKVVGHKTLAVEDFDYFTTLITGAFFDEESVIECLRSTSEMAEREAVAPYTRIEMQIEEHFGSKLA